MRRDHHGTAVPQAARPLLVGLLAVALTTSCSMAVPKTAPVTPFPPTPGVSAGAVANPTEAAYPGREEVAAAASATPTAGRNWVFQRSSPTALGPGVLPTAWPTAAVDGRKTGFALTLADQLGGDVRLLGDDGSGNILVSIGARVKSFATSGSGGEPIGASPLLPGLPTAFARSGDTGVLATPFGMSVLSLEDGRLDLAANLPLGPVADVDMMGDTALALVPTLPDYLWSAVTEETELAVVDLSRPAQPLVKAILKLPGYAGNIAVHGKTAFVTASDTRRGMTTLMMLDLSMPDRPVVVSTGPWPWNTGGHLYLDDITIEDNDLLVTRSPEGGAINRACLYVFGLGPDGTPTLRETRSCPKGSVYWAHLLGETILLASEKHIDASPLGQPSERESLIEKFDPNLWLWLTGTSSTRIGNRVMFAPIKSVTISNKLEVLTLAMADGGDVTAGSFPLQARSVNSFDGVTVDGDSVVAMAIDFEGSSPPALLSMRVGAGGLLEQSVAKLDRNTYGLLLDGSTLFATLGDAVDTYTVEAGDPLLRHLGVIEPRLPYCPDQYSMVKTEATEVSPGTPCTDNVSVLGLHGPLLVTYRTRYSGEDSEPGPLVYDVSDPRQPELLGMVLGNQLVVSRTTEGRRLPVSISVDYVNGLKLDENLASAAVVRRAGRAYLSYFQLRNCRGGCAPDFPGRLEVRDPGLGLDQPPIARLDLPESLAKAVPVEVDGVTYLLVARGGPTPGLYEVSLAEPDAPRLVGFFPLAVEPRALSTTGGRVYIADGEAGLIVLDTAAVMGHEVTPTATSTDGG